MTKKLAYNAFVKDVKGCPVEQISGKLIENCPKKQLKTLPKPPLKLPPKKPEINYKPPSKGVTRSQFR